MGTGWLVGALAVLGCLASCKSEVSVTLCNTSSQPVDYAVRFTRTSPKEAKGTIAPHARATVSAVPEGEGDYTIELHRGATVHTQSAGYYTSEGSADMFSIDDKLGLTEGCK